MIPPLSPPGTSGSVVMESYSEIARAEALLHAGYEHQMRGELDRAEMLYRRSMEAHESAVAHIFLGWAMSKQGRYREAIAECLEAIRLDPDMGNSYNDIGAYYIALGLHAEAEPWLRQALDAPRYAQRQYPHANLALVLEARGDLDGAMAEYQAALALVPDYAAARGALIRLRALRN